MADKSRQDLGYAVTVMEPLEVWAGMGGWGDGPITLHPGAKIFLEFKEGDTIYFSAGNKHLEPSESVGLGGLFSAVGLDKVLPA